MKHKLHEQIDAIMDEFDFDHVYSMMVDYNWTWGGGDDSEVPHVSDIRKTSRRLLRRLVEENCRITSTGGFTALKLNDTLYLFWGVDSQMVEFEE
jgi:hypothetical protein